jgi:hypothetical protein
VACDEKRVLEQMSRLVKVLSDCADFSQTADARLLARSPSISGWSAAEHLEHIAIGNQLTFDSIVQLLDDPQPAELTATTAQAERFLREGVIVRGASKHPEFTSPRGVSLEKVRTDLDAQLLGYGELRWRSGDFAASNAVDPHDELGPLTAVQWLRFTEIHTAHHLQIAKEVVAAQK